MKLTKLVAVIVLACAVLGTSRPAAAAPQGEKNDSIVVMISLDGLAGFYLDDPKADIPTLRALMKDGARAAGMKAVSPSVTWPNHTTLVTGDMPAKHGVVGNNYYDRATAKRVTLISDPVYDKDEIVKVPTIYDVAHEAGLKTLSIRWPASRNAKTLDWAVPDVAGDELLHKYSTPSLMAECKEAGVWEDGKADATASTSDRRLISDEACTKIFNFMVHKHRPQLGLLHLIDVDHTQHQFGPRSNKAYAAIKKIDEQVGEVWEQLKKDFPGKATLVIVSDHGFSPIDRIVLPNVVLRNAGMMEVKGPRVVSQTVYNVVQGGCSMLYILDDSKRDEIVARVKKEFTGMEGILKVVGPEGVKDYGVADAKVDPHAPDMLLFAKLGYAFGDTAAGALTFAEKPERKGTHGHDPSIPDLHASFIAWGKGIKAGANVGEIQNTAVAPTVAKLLGVKMHDTDGKPLTEIISK